MRKTFHFLLFFLPAFSFSQLRTDPTPAEVSKARLLDAKWKDNKDTDLAIIRGEQTFTFKNDKDLTVEETSSEVYMNIRPKSTDIFFNVDYDETSKVRDFTVRNRKGRKKMFKVFDEYLKIQGIFYHDRRIKYTRVIFPKQGYIYTFEYKKTYTDPKYLTSVYFSKNNITYQKTVRFVIPKGVDVELKEMHFEGYHIKKTKIFDTKKNAYVITYRLKDIPPVAHEKHTPGPSYLYPHVLVLTKSFTHNGQKKKIFENTADLYAWYHALIGQLKEDPSVYAGKVKELTRNARTDRDKVRNIFYWVQDHIHYIAFEDGIVGFKPDESQNVYNKRYGDCKGMANLLTGMLKEAGFDARRTWLGTRHIAYDYSIPSLAVDNHMICTLFLDGKPYYLDATESFVPFGEYAERIQGRQVMIEDGDKYLLKKIPEHRADHNRSSYLREVKVEGDVLKGHVRETYRGQARTSFLQGYDLVRKDKKEDALEFYLRGNDKNYNLSNIRVKGLENRENNIILDYDFVLHNAVTSFGDEMYIDPDYDKPFAGLDLKNRKKPYQLAFKKNLESQTVFEIPAGYKVTDLPADLHVTNEDFRVDVHFKVEGNKIIYTSHFVFPYALIHQENLSRWQKEVYEPLMKIYNTQITLQKQ